jgi:hypothetical protein
MSRRLPVVSLRRLVIADLAVYRAHLRRLDAETRRRRFGAPVTDDFLENHVEHAFTAETVLHGLFVGGRLVGSGEIRGGGRWVGEAEAGIGIEADHRSADRERRLAARVLRSARNRGVERIRSDRSTFGARGSTETAVVSAEADGAVVVAVSRKRSVASLAAEGVCEGSGRLARFFDLLGHFAMPALGRVA